MYNVPNDWKLGNYMELSPEEKLKWLHSAIDELKSETAELEEEISQLGGSDVSVTAEYTQQTYNNKLATITVDDVATDIYAPKVVVTTISSSNDGPEIARIKVGNTTSQLFSVKSSTVYVEEDIDGTVGLFSADWNTIYNYAGSQVFAVCVPTADTNTMYYLDKVWSEVDAQTSDTTYYAKFGSKTYYATSDDVPLELVTT